MATVTSKEGLTPEPDDYGSVILVTIKEKEIQLHTTKRFIITLTAPEVQILLTDLLIRNIGRLE